MATTILAAAATTKDPLANELKVSMRDTIAMLDTDDTQFTTMLMDPRLQKESANSFKEEWLEDLYMPRLSTLAISAASGDTVLNTPTGEGFYFRAGDVVRNTVTGEAVLVTTGNSTSSFTCTRGLGSVAAASAATGSDLVIVGHSNVQAGTLPTIMMTQRTTNYNYTQIHRHSYGFARTAQQTQWYGGPLLDKERAKKIVEHKRSIEQTLFFGPRFYTATGPQHTCGGVNEYIVTNVSAQGGSAFTKANLQTFLRTGLQYGNAGNKVLFVAPIVAGVMGQFLQDNWIRSGPDETVFGARIDGVVSSSYGGPEIPIVIKRAWNNFQNGSGAQYGSRAFLIDMLNVQYLTLQDTVQLRNRQAPDYDGVKEEYLTEHTLRVEIEKSHQTWTGITS